MLELNIVQGLQTLIIIVSSGNVPQLQTFSFFFLNNTNNTPRMRAACIS